MTPDAPPSPDETINGKWSDRNVDLVISDILAWGVTAASIIVIIGGAIFLSAHGGDHPQLSVFQGEPLGLRSPTEIIKLALTGNGAAIIQAGVLILLATPFLRVAFGAYAFFKQRDFTYVCIALIVLSVLTYSLFAS